MKRKSSNGRVNGDGSERRVLGVRRTIARSKKNGAAVADLRRKVREPNMRVEDGKGLSVSRADESGGGSLTFR